MSETLPSISLIFLTKEIDFSNRISNFLSFRKRFDWKFFRIDILMLVSPLSKWRLAGQYQEEKKYLTEAILSYNKARRIKPSVLFVFDKVVSLLSELVSKYKTEFSVDDLKMLKESISILENFHSVNFPAQKNVLAKLHDLFLRIDYLIKYHPIIAEESKATFQVQKIYNAITDEMTMPEVHQELAKTLANIIRRGKAKDKKEKRKTSKKTK